MSISHELSKVLSMRTGKLLSYFAKEGNMFSFDLKSGYHHVDIAQEHQTFLGFSWRKPDSVKEIFYVCTVLPFGLSSAPYVFTKVLKPLANYWRLQGLCIPIFLDDGWAIIQIEKVVALRPGL